MRVPDPIRSRADPARAAWLGVGLAMAGGLAVGLYGIKERSFWLDEATSITIARLAPADFLRTLATGEANSALYYLLLAVWRQLGEGEIRLRLLSVVLGLATIPLLYLVGRRTVGTAAAVGACALLVVQPLVVPYLQEVRGYTLAMLLATATILAWLVAVEHDRVRSWVVFTIVATASLYAHFFCGLVFASLLTLVIVGAVPRTRRMAVSLGVIALGSVPLLVFIAFGDVGQVSWIPALSPERLGDVLGEFAGGWIGLAIILAVGLVLAVTDRRDGAVDGRLLLFAWLVVPIVAAVIVSIWKPLLVPRYLIVVAPPLALLASAGLLRIRPRAFGVIALAAAVALSFGPFATRSLESREDWRGAAGWVASVARPGDRIVYEVPSGRKPFSWYLDTIPGIRPADTPIEEVRDGRTRVWLVLYRMDLSAHQALLATLPALEVVESKAFLGLRVQLLEPAAP